MRCLRASGGQASVELIAMLPLVLLLGLVGFQLLAAGYSAVLAGHAAEAGAIAVAAGTDATAAARMAVPGWSRAHMKVIVDDDAVRVSMRPPSPLDAVARELEVHADAAIGIVP